MLKQAQHDIKPHTTHFTHDTHSKKAAFTLAEGATHIDMSDNFRRVAFTLAEVLITVGIIGIVAAMTIPTLIVNYQKREFASRLSQTFSVLSNAIKMAQVEYGDVATWGYQKYYGTTVDPNDDNSQYIKEYAEKYFLPYLRVSKNYGTVKLKDIGYSGFKSKDGKSYYNENSKVYTTEVNNGTIIFFAYNGSTTEIDGVTTHFISAPIISIDINGKAGPNVIGRDVFQFTLSTNKNKLLPSGAGYKRSSLLNKCTENPAGKVYDNFACTALIQMDGWKFAEDYPW